MLDDTDNHNIDNAKAEDNSAVVQDLEQETENNLNKDSFSVMTFNIQHGLVWETQEINLSAFATYIGNEDPDVCGLNEVRGKGSINPEYTNQAEKIGSEADYHNYFGESVKIKGSEPYGNAILTKTPLISVERIKIPDPTDGGWFEPRSVIKAVTEIEGKEICFLVSHFGLTDNEKLNAVNKVCEIIDSVDLPLVLMGDFNMRPDDERLIPIRERMSDSDLLCEKRGEYTFATYAPQCKIDYIFYRGLDCISAKVIKAPLSDHYPIICSFAVNWH